MSAANTRNLSVKTKTSLCKFLPVGTAVPDRAAACALYRLKAKSKIGMTAVCVVCLWCVGVCVCVRVWCVYECVTGVCVTGVYGVCVTGVYCVCVGMCVCVWVYVCVCVCVSVCLSVCTCLTLRIVVFVVLSPR